MDFKAVVNRFINPLKCVLPLEVKLSGKACLKCEERQLERHWRCGWARVSSRTLKSVGPGVGDPICNQNFGALDKDKIFCSPLLQLHGVGTGWVIILLPLFPSCRCFSPCKWEQPNHPQSLKLYLRKGLWALWSPGWFEISGRRTEQLFSCFIAISCFLLG